MSTSEFTCGENSSLPCRWRSVASFSAGAVLAANIGVGALGAMYVEHFRTKEATAKGYEGQRALGCTAVDAVAQQTVADALAADDEKAQWFGDPQSTGGYGLHLEQKYDTPIIDLKRDILPSVLAFPKSTTTGERVELVNRFTRRHFSTPFRIATTPRKLDKFTIAPIPPTKANAVTASSTRKFLVGFQNLPVQMVNASQTKELVLVDAITAENQPPDTTIMGLRNNGQIVLTDEAYGDPEGSILRHELGHGLDGAYREKYCPNEEDEGFLSLNNVNFKYKDDDWTSETSVSSSTVSSYAQKNTLEDKAEIIKELTGADGANLSLRQHYLNKPLGRKMTLMAIRLEQLAPGSMNFLIRYAERPQQQPIFGPKPVR